MQLFEGVNINKGKPHRYGIRRPEGGAHSSTTLCQLQTPIKEIFNMKEWIIGPNRKRCTLTLHLLQKINYHSNSANKKPYLLQLSTTQMNYCFSTMDFHSKQLPLNLLFFSMK